MPLPYGFVLAPDGHIAIDQEKANGEKAGNLRKTFCLSEDLHGGYLNSDPDGILELEIQELGLSLS